MLARIPSEHRDQARDLDGEKVKVETPRLEYALKASIESSIESKWSDAGSVDGICKAVL